jgi:hypothetical protein
MTSEITTANMDENFPVAGRDNDSQGFRDNFFEIKQNLGFAKSEIDDLQGNVARTDRDNDFDGNVISGAVLLDTTLKLNTTYSTGTISDQDIIWTGGFVHVIRVENDVELTLTGWPTNNNYACVRLVLTADGTERLVTIGSTGGGTMKTDGNAAWASNILTVINSASPTIVEAFTYDGGATVYLRYLGAFS